MHPYMHTSMHPCIHAPLHPCIHASMHPCMHACMHACIHTYIHTYIHIYIHLDIWQFTDEKHGINASNPFFAASPNRNGNPCPRNYEMDRPVSLLFAVFGQRNPNTSFQGIQEKASCSGESQGIIQHCADLSAEFPALKGKGLGNRLSAANTETSSHEIEKMGSTKLWTFEAKLCGFSQQKV